MALPELTKKKVEKTLSEYCESRIPAHIRDKLRLSFEFRGNSVTLFEDRPRIDDESQWTHLKFAQFRLNPKSLRWDLYCADRNLKWHHYSGPENFDSLLADVDDDETGIFYG